MILMILIRLYQVLISSWTPRTCRFYPTCSQYSLEAIRRYGAVRGSWLAVKRIALCGPWHPGGHDPVP